MDKHDIDISVVRCGKLSNKLFRLFSKKKKNTLSNSSANPWLDFLDASKAHTLANDLNEDLEQYCSTSPILSETRLRRLYGFGLLPLVPDVTISSLLDTVQQISRLSHLKGIIMGTRGIGKGLDDDALDPVWGAIEKAGLVVFLHPHYGVDSKAWGEKDNGHVLPLALGFPFETTIVSPTTSDALSLGRHMSFSGRDSPYSFRCFRPLSILAYITRSLRWRSATIVLSAGLLH